MGKYVVKSGGAKPKEKTIYNMPLETSLEDISGYNRTSVYQGDTTQTITADNGLYLYNNRVILDMGFLNDVVDNKFKIDFDFKYNSTGTSSYPNYRRIIWWDSLGVEVSANCITIVKYGDSANGKTNATYNGTAWHHGTLICDMDTKSFVFIVDNGTESLYLSLTSNFPQNSIVLGESWYGLNGYIKNFIITTGGA